MSSYVSEGELDTLEHKWGFVWCLRGHPHAFESACPRRCATTKRHSSTSDEERKWALVPFSGLIKEPRCVPIPAQQEQVCIILPICAYMCM